MVVVLSVAASLIAAGLFLFQNSRATKVYLSDLKPSQVLTWDCEYPAYKPEAIMIYCGDGGAYISKIKWNSWSQGGASGTGEYFRNLCEPDCAAGKIVHADVDVRLSDLTPRKGKYYLRTLDMSSLNGKDFSWGESGTFHWDVMEFAEQMNS
jgi:hypothetical protein